MAEDKPAIFLSPRAVLEKAGVAAGARQVAFNGLDQPVLPTTPDFVKALDVDHALDGEVMLAWAMNGAACVNRSAAAPIEHGCCARNPSRRMEGMA